MALAIWVIGENFGGILTGQATDPNTGPLLVLVALAHSPLAGGQAAPDSGGQAGDQACCRSACWKSLSVGKPK